MAPEVNPFLKPSQHFLQVNREDLVMPQINFTQFILLISEALRTEDGPKLAGLLKPVEEHGKMLIKEFRNPTVRETSSQGTGSRT